MNKYLRMFLIVFGIIVAFSWIPFSDNVVVGEQLCVDGNNNINLEGMMCEKTEYNINGLSFMESIFISLVLAIAGLFIFAFSLFANVSGEEQ